MPKLPKLSGNQIVKALNSLGFYIARQKGSHIVMKKVTENETFGCVVPNHKEVAVGTLAGILKQAKISNEEFIDAL